MEKSNNFIEQKSRKTSRKSVFARITALMLCMVVMLAAFTGCGMCSADDHTEGKSGTTGNMILKMTDDGYYTCNASEGVSELIDGTVWNSMNLSCNTANGYGLKANDRGITFLRDFTILLLKAAFNGGYAYAGSDNFANNKGSGDSSFTLDPAHVLTETNNITVTQLGAGFQGPFGGVMSALIGVASAIMVALWAMNFIQQVVQERFTMESALKGFMQLMMGLLVITNAGRLVGAFAETGNALMSLVTAGTPSSVFSAFQAELEGYMRTGIFSLTIGFRFFGINIPIGTIWLDYGPMIVMVMIIIPLIAEIICAYKIVSMMVMRMLELVVRVVVSPIPLAFSAHNGFSQESMRYFRGVMACAAQPMLMMMGVAMTGTIANTVMAILGGGDASTLTGLGGIVGMTLTYFVLSAYLGQTSQLAKEIIAR